MSDRRDPRPPDPPMISVATLLGVLEELSPDWQIGVEDSASLHIFDNRGRPRGFIGIATAQTVRVDAVDGDE